jgi:hypothetical protein
VQEQRVEFGTNWGHEAFYYALYKGTTKEGYNLEINAEKSVATETSW